MAVAAMLAVFFGTTVVVAIHGSVHPPSHVETIDLGKALADARFRRQGVWVDAAGKVQATIVATAFAWLPPQMTIPADTPVTFHLTSLDVVHGFEIMRTNGQSMVVPEAVASRPVMSTA